MKLGVCCFVFFCFPFFSPMCYGFLIYRRPTAHSANAACEFFSASACHLSIHNFLHSSFLLQTAALRLPFSSSQFLLFSSTLGKHFQHLRKLLDSLVGFLFVSIVVFSSKHRQHLRRLLSTLAGFLCIPVVFLFSNQTSNTFKSCSVLRFLR